MSIYISEKISEIIKSICGISQETTKQDISVSNTERYVLFSLSSGFMNLYFLGLFTWACAAARRAIGTRNGEHDT